MKKLVIILLSLFIFSSIAYASTPAAFVGGLRGKGAAIGLDFSELLRMGTLYAGPGIELCTGPQGIVTYFDVKARVATVASTMGFYLKGGVTAFFGSETQLGVNFFAGLSNVFNVKPLFFEIGADFCKDMSLSLQGGYRFRF